MRQLGIRLVALGVLAQAAGLGLDAWLHAKDEALASHESVFSLTNPGHAVFLAGLALTVAGAALLVSGRRVVAAILGVAVVGGAGFADAATSSPDAAASAGTHSHSSSSPTPTTVHVDAATSHGDGPSLPVLSADDASLLDSQLAIAHAAAARYPTLADATADGYIFGTAYEARIGAHYLKYKTIDERFDPAQPEMLLYEGETPTSRLVGLTYYVIASHAPEGFAGRADHWHQHRDTCITPEGPVFAGDGYRRCRANGRLSWMLHAWVVPEFESPQGVFSAENIRLR